MKRLLLVGLIGLALIGCTATTAPRTLPESNRLTKEILPTPTKEQQLKWENQAKNDLEMLIVDSHGSLYKMLAPNCGYINPKNKSGGFNGYMKFNYYIDKKGGVDADFENQPSFFQTAWRYACGVELEK